MNLINCTITNEKLKANELIITGITYEDRLYYSMETIASILDISYKTVQRKLQKKREIQNNNMLEYIIKADKNYVSSKLFQNTKYYKKLESKSTVASTTATNQENKSSKQELLIETYKNYKWDFFNSINQDYFTSQIKAIDFITDFCKRLTLITKIDFYLLYTIEKNVETPGYHIHFLISLENKNNIVNFETQLIRLFKNHRRQLNYSVAEYESQKNGLRYIFKQAYRKDFEHHLFTPQDFKYNEKENYKN